MVALCTGLVLVALTVSPATGTHGVRRATIKIGLHAPLTGASPVPSDSIEKGKDLFFRWLESRGREIHGRNVKVILKNDNYNPSSAVSVCKEMVEDDHVFLLIGISGATQMEACARYAESVGVPYVSPGVPSRFLAGFRRYFAVTLAPKAEGRLLADYLVEKMRARRRANGVAYFNAPSWVPPKNAFERRLVNRNATLDYERGVSSAAGAAEARLIAQELEAAGIRNVFVHVSPVFFLQILNAANNIDYSPHWVGLRQIAHDTVADVGCRNGTSLGGSRAFSPWPAVAESDRFDPAFKNASRRFYPNKTPDDFMWQLWAIDRVLAKMFGRAGRELSRRRFVHRVERSDFNTPVGPRLHYTPEDHLGARMTRVLRADCSPGKWRTMGSFRASG
jgi:branched-chain amino acid transport system substrate-binding protein